MNIYQITSLLLSGGTMLAFALYVTRGVRGARKYAWGILAALFLYMVAEKHPFSSIPWLWNQPGKQPSTLVVGESGQDFWDELLAMLPPAWWPVGASTNDFDGDLVYDVWEGRVFSDALVFDSFADRDGDGLPDVLEFVFGTDPRTPNTSGGIIDDNWLSENGLDPLLVWDDVLCPSNNVTYGEMYRQGWTPDPANTNDYAAWLGRGLEFGVDAWPEGEDAEGDITLVSVRVTGAAKGSAMVCIGPVRHIGPKAKIYALRSGRRYNVIVRGLHGKTGLAGEVEIKAVTGMISFTENFTRAFVLNGGSSSQQGGGMMLMNAPAENVLGGIDTWWAKVVPANNGCIHGRLKLTVQVTKGEAGVSTEEPGKYQWRWTDGKPWGADEKNENASRESDNRNREH